MGSNEIAIGKGGNRDHHHGILLGNPHFPWVGTERLYQMQLTVPGQMNVEGAVCRRAAGAGRSHRQPGVEPHRLDGIPVRPDAAAAEQDLAHHLHR